MVTATVPLEVTVTDFDTDVPTATLPKDSEVALKLNAGVVALSCSATLFEELFALADSVAVCVVETGATLAVNEAVDAPEATLTLPGTVTDVELLVRATLWPADGAGELRDTVQVVLLAPVKEVPPHEHALIVGGMVDAAPLTLIEAVFETVPCVAVNVTVCKVADADTFAAKLALLAPDGTVREEGTVIMLLLLARPTTNPELGAAEDNVTVQASVPDPIMVVLAQLRPESVAVLVPLP
jgi:hypothetical protein